MRYKNRYCTTNRWLTVYDEDFDGIVPFMAVIQVNKGEVRTVLNYRELNIFQVTQRAVGFVSLWREICGGKWENKLAGSSNEVCK